MFFLPVVVVAIAEDAVLGAAVAAEEIEDL